MIKLDEQLVSESMQGVFEHAPCGYALTLPDGRLVRVNETLVGWTGRSREQLLDSTRFQDLLSIPGKIFYENQYAPLLRLQGSVQGVAFELVRQDRAPLPVLVSAVQRATPDGIPALIACILLDATDRRAYERELQLRRVEAEQLAAIVTNSSDAIVTTSASGEVLTWNAAAAELFGFPAADIVGRGLLSILPTFDLSSLAGASRRVPGGPSPVQMDTTGLRSDGSSIDVSLGATPQLGLLGELKSVSLIIRDISERRALERLQQEFLAMTSHELRNPVASIKGHAQLMRRRGRFEERSIDAIVAAADHLDGLIGDLMLAAQIQAERLDLELVPSDLVREARAAADQYSGQGLPVRFESQEDVLPVLADRLRLKQVFANLLTNAFKYSPDQGDVLVRVSRIGEDARVAVIDHGMGIPAAAIPHLFDRFFRVEGSARQAQGLGLGLFISRRLVEAHNGHIVVHSEQDQGSTFTVVLPVLTSDSTWMAQF